MQSKMWADPMLFIRPKGNLSLRLNRVKVWAASSSLGKDVNWQIIYHRYWVSLLKTSLYTDCREQ